jgi:ribosomal protein S21
MVKPFSEQYARVRLAVSRAPALQAQGLQEEIIKEVKRHAFYLKPGQKKRIESVLARKRNRKKRTRDGEPEPNRQ